VTDVRGASPPAGLDRASEPFRLAYDPPAIRYGRGSVASLSEELGTHGFTRGLVVTGQTVGSTPAVIDPVRDGLGGRLAGVFAETTPGKRLSTAGDGLAVLREQHADVIVALGGGSSLDVAKQISTLAARARGGVDAEAAVAEASRELQDHGSVTVPDEGLVPIVAVPTTLAGADVSQVGGLAATPDSGFVSEAVTGGISHPELMPVAVVYDPTLVATTPERVLAASAMNGFDKGIETLYASTATPITDATAMRGLSVFREGLLAFGEGVREDWVFDALVRGVLLVQYGISRPEDGTLSLIHAFGHGLTSGYSVQQGVAHAVAAPHVLEYIFERTDGRRNLLAEALDTEHAADPAEAVVAAVTEVRDTLGLPTRLRDVDGPDPDAFTEVARYISDDPLAANLPPDLDPTVEEIEDVLEAAW
jgi:alcohol dehydrogenase class IV